MIESFGFSPKGNPADTELVATAEFFILSAPEPDSTHAGDFDSIIVTVQQALEYENYILDRFRFPDAFETDPNKRTRNAFTGESKIWEEPGILAFRREEAGHRYFQFCLVVPEDPHAGFRPKAMDHAFDLIERYGHEEKQINLIGPWFSGSLGSLLIGIRKWRQEDKVNRRNVEFNLISGTATSPANAESICYFNINEFGSYEQNQRVDYVRYRSMVVEDDQTIDFLSDQLSTRYSIDPTRVVWLVESSLYGQTFFEHDGIVVPFPIHIRQVRTARAKAERIKKKSTQQNNSGTLLDLNLESSGRLRHTPEPFDAEVSSRRAELAMANILNALSRRRTQAVVIVATDIKDKLFLASVIHEFAKDVRLVTIESDILLAHQNYRQYCRGMLVTSSYSPTVYHPKRDVGKMLYMFPGDRSRGVFEACLAILNAEKALYESTAVLAETQEGLKLRGRWLSVVGNTGIWPLNFVSEQGDTAALEADLESQFPESEPWSFFFYLFCVLLIVLAWSLICATRRGFFQEKIWCRNQRTDWGSWWAWIIFLPQLVFVAGILLLVHAWLAAPLTNIHRLADLTEVASFNAVLFLVVWFVVCGASVYYAMHVIFIMNQVKSSSQAKEAGDSGDNEAENKGSSSEENRGGPSDKEPLGEQIQADSSNGEQAADRTSGESRIWSFWVPTVALSILTGLLTLKLVSLFLIVTHQEFSSYYMRRMIALQSGVSPFLPTALLAMIGLLWVVRHHVHRYQSADHDSTEHAIDLESSRTPEKAEPPADDPNPELPKTFKQKLACFIDPSQSKITGVFPDFFLTQVAIAIIFLFTPWIYTVFYYNQFTLAIIKSVEGSNYDMALNILAFFCILISLAAFGRAVFTWRYLRQYLRHLAKNRTLNGLDLSKAFRNFELEQHPGFWLFTFLMGPPVKVKDDENAKPVDGQPASPKDAAITEEAVEKTAVLIHEALTWMLLELAFAGAGLMLLLAALHVYPFEPGRLLAMYMSFLTALFVPVAGVILVQMNRNPVLSWLLKTREKKVSWNRGFMLGMFVFVVMPLGALIFSQFPELQASFMAWLAPLLQQYV